MPQTQPSPLPSPSTAACALPPRTTPRYPITTSEYAIASAWAPANAIEEHLVRKIGGLGVTIENLLNTLSTMDPALPNRSNLIASFSLTLARLQKTQTALEAELREIQSQRGIRATHPFTCEHIPAQADARPYVAARGSTAAAPLYKESEPIAVDAGFPEDARQLLETYYGTRIRPVSEFHGGKVVFTPRIIAYIAARMNVPVPACAVRVPPKPAAAAPTRPRPRVTPPSAAQTPRKRPVSALASKA